MHKPALLLASVALVLAGAGCTPSTPSATPTTSEPAATNAPAATNTPAPPSNAPSAAQEASANAVSIQNFAFSASTLSVKAGDTVTWTNHDAATHTVTADDGSFDSGSIATGQTFSHTFTSAGTFSYHCKFHPMMKGAVHVQ